MMPIKRALITLSLVFLFLFNADLHNTYSQTTTPAPSPEASKTSDLEKQIEEYQAKVTELQDQSKTLDSQINIMDSQIKLTELRIKDAEEKISNLQKNIQITKEKVSSLQDDIYNFTKALVGRIKATYQLGSVKPWEIFLTSSNIDGIFNRLKYMKLVQISDKRRIYAAEQAKNDYANQKEIYEQKEKEVQALNKILGDYTEQLDGQKKEKESLLDVTRSDEKKYQNLLAQARAEFNAIQGIVAGNGVETGVGQVSEGDRIATIIDGPSCNSGGGHVHFIVSSGGVTQNPFSYLSSIDSENCSGSSCGSSDGDPFNPSGSWNWPVSGPVKMYQGYGSTWATKNTWVGQIYSSHNGIDIRGSSLDVKAVKSGALFRGSYTGSGGCRLPYVRVRQEGGLDTLYLHVYY